MNSSPPYLLGVRLLPERVASFDTYPFTIPFVRDLNLEFTHPVTFLIGENGSGKSTLIEALAGACRLPTAGGARVDMGSSYAPQEDNTLSAALRATFHTMPRDGYFLRAEFHAHFASLLDERQNDPGFSGDPYANYGGQSLHSRSHGEAFLAVIQHRFRNGIFLLDEPESALSPQRQLTLLAQMHAMVSARNTQFIIATHSPILMSYPGAQLLSFDGDRPCEVQLADTSHYQVTRGVLEHPDRYMRYLFAEDDGGDRDDNRGRGD